MGLLTDKSKIKKIDQQNTPDFMGYHMNQKSDDCYQNHTKSSHFNEVKDISITTDGINSKNEKESSQK